MQWKALLVEHEALGDEGTNHYAFLCKGTVGRGFIPGRIDIDERPGIIDEKSRLGDWELDTIIGVGQKGAIVSMVERFSKLTKLKKVSQKTAQEVKQALIEALTPMKEVVLTMTADNGNKFTDHKNISRSLEASFYFAKPYHSWERGLNEHTNGLMRQYLPKGQGFSDVTDQDLEKIKVLLNNRSRKVLNFSTPLEVFDESFEGVRLSHCNHISKKSEMLGMQADFFCKLEKMVSL